jgi:single-strand DNA-binding protein
MNNEVKLTGNLGKDPEIKQFENYKLATFSLATTERYKTKAGEDSSKTEWHTICAWGKLADRIESEFKKGNFVSITGSIRYRNYDDKNGDKHYVTEIHAKDIKSVQKKAA